MRAEFVRPDDPDQVVASARWSAGSVHMDPADDARVTEALRRIFRPSPVTVDEAWLRGPGTSGPVTLEPGDLRWFMEAARARSDGEGLAVRFVDDDWQGMGWDPAGAYRTFRQSVGFGE